MYFILQWHKGRRLAALPISNILWDPLLRTASTANFHHRPSTRPSSQRMAQITGHRTPHAMRHSCRLQSWLRERNGKFPRETEPSPRALFTHLPVNSKKDPNIDDLRAYHAIIAGKGKRMLYFHYSDVIMSTIESQITGLMIVYSTVYSGTNQTKHQRSTSLAFMRGIHRWTRKMFPFDDVIMPRNLMNVSKV